MLQQELENISVILRNNGYPKFIIDKGISNKSARFQSLPKFGPNKYSAYLNMPWTGKISPKFENKINLLLSIVLKQLNHEFFSQPEKSFYPSIKMLFLPFNKVWSCTAVIAGTWVAHLYVWRINQHVPNFIRRKQQPTKILQERKCKIRSIATQQQCVSASGLHLMQNPEYATHYNNDQFSILAKTRSMFHLSVLEATYIKINKPIFCPQKEFVYSLQTFTSSNAACQ